VSPDWDNNWRTGGSLDEIIDEAHLSPRWVLSAIEKFALERKIRLEKLNKQVPDLD
jgi:transketolase